MNLVGRYEMLLVEWMKVIDSQSVRRSESENVILYKSEIVKKWGSYLNPMDYSKLVSEIREYNLNKILK